MAQKVIFQMATVKGSLCTLKKSAPTDTWISAAKGKDKWKERLQEKVRSVPDGRRVFSGEQEKLYFGERSSFWRLLSCFFLQQALA